MSPLAVSIAASRRVRSAGAARTDLGGRSLGHRRDHRHQTHDEGCAGRDACSQPPVPPPRMVITLQQPLAGLARILEIGRSPGEGTAQLTLKFVGRHQIVPFMMPGGGSRGRQPATCERLSQPGCGAGCGAGDRRGGTAEDVRDLGDGQVLPVAQHQHGALPRRKLSQRPAELREVIDLPQRPQRALVCGVDAGVLRPQFRLPPRPAASIIQHEIDQDTAGVGGRMIHRPHPVPPPGHPQERLLDQVLGVPHVPRHQIAGAQQRV